MPLGEGLVFRTSGTWPRTKALFCYPVELEEWPDEPDVVDRVPVRSCVRRGAAIDLAVPAAPEPTTAEVRAWADAQGLDVPRAGRLRAEVWDAWRAAHEA